MTGPVVELGGRLSGSIVFLSVLVQQLGVPIPAEPTLIVAGSAGARHPLTLPGVVAFALLAVLAADTLWFVLGRLYGRRMLWLIYRLSRSPDRWMQRTESVYRRRGLKSVALIKFIPGLPMLAPLYAGAMKARYGPFLLYDLSAAAIWASLTVLGGVLFRRQVGALRAVLARASVPAVVALAIGIAGVIVWRWWNRRRNPGPPRAARSPSPTGGHPSGRELGDDVAPPQSERVADADLGGAQPRHGELPNLERLDLDASNDNTADHQPPNGQHADRKRPDRDGAHGDGHQCRPAEGQMP